MDIVSINPVSIVATVVNILILFLILRFFLVKPVDRILAERDRQIAERKQAAEKAEAEAKALKQEYEEKIGGIEQMSKEALSEAEQKGSKEYERIVAEAKEKADEILEEASRKAEIQERELKADAAKMLADLVSSAAAKVVVAGENSGLDSDLYDKFLKKAGEDN